ncbi:MAG: acetate/propionate family kinase [Candidatus Nanopelagicales bacterium]
MSLTLVLNAGSSTLKFQVFKGERSLQRGTIEKPLDYERRYGFHFDAFEDVKTALIQEKINFDEFDYVGYRIVHGGEKFSHSIVISDDAMNDIADLSTLAPLHIPPVIEVLKASSHTFPNAIRVAVFDTAFHATMKKETYTYPLPRQLREKYGIRKYGFHGMSHQYVTEIAAEQLQKNAKQLNIITCHLGAGSSISAIQKGESVDTSMGFTPLAGLMMATRSGDIDPGILLHLLRDDFEVDELDHLLNSESGLKAIAGTGDMRKIIQNSLTDESARLAREMYIKRVIHYIGAYLALVPDVEAIVFTGGIGENDDSLRLEIESRLRHLGVGTTIKILVIPTNEELAIARECWKIGKK